MNYINITNENRERINDFIIKQWYSTKMKICGREFDMTLVNSYLL